VHSHRWSRIPLRAVTKDHRMGKKKVVVIGGGTGSHTILTGLKKMECDLTAVVTMSDDGGSSGRLRDELGQLPPGDIRQCLLALADDNCSSGLLRKLFNYRFTAGEGLNGHSFGNLLLSALTDITGSVDAAVIEASRMLHIKGAVLPVTLTNSVLKARLVNGAVIEGESSINQRVESPELPIDYIFLEPTACPYPPVLEAIERADAIVIGPGDIYTSILPNFLVTGVARAVNSSAAIKIYVCNLMTKPGESDGFKASDFLRLLCKYMDAPTPLDYLLVNNAGFPEQMRKRYLSCGQHPVELDEENCRPMAANVVKAPLTSVGVYLRHNPHALADTVMKIVESPLNPSTRAGGTRPRRREYAGCSLSC
jgi:uncharacterized cofD-like protein